MQSAKEKLSNMGSAAKEHIDIFKAKAEEKGKKATARTEEEKKIAEEERKAKEAEAKMDLHQSKADHKADKHYPLTASTLPTYPPGGHPPGHRFP